MLHSKFLANPGYIRHCLKKYYFKIYKNYSSHALSNNCQFGDFQAIKCESKLSRPSPHRRRRPALTMATHLCNSHGGQSPAAGLCIWPAGTHIGTGRSSRRRHRVASEGNLGSPGCSLCLCLDRLSRTWGRKRSKKILKNSRWGGRSTEKTENRRRRKTATLCSHPTEASSELLSELYTIHFTSRE